MIFGVIATAACVSRHCINVETREVVSLGGDYNDAHARNIKVRGCGLELPI